MSSADIHRPRAVGTLAVVCLLAAGPLQAQSGFLPNDPDRWTVAGTADHQEGGGEPLRGCERGVHRLPERGVLQDESTSRGADYEVRGRFFFFRCAPMSISSIYFT